jgi:hypothetical protein
MRRSVRHVALASFSGFVLAACAVLPPNRSTGAATAESVTSQHPGRMTWAGALAALVLICAGCGGVVTSGNTHNGKAGVLKVTVIEAGGPALPGGGTPKFAAAGAEVNVTSTGTSLSSHTDKAGVATFRLPTGSYSVSVPTCGPTGKRAVTVTAAGSSSLTWNCPIP